MELGYRRRSKGNYYRAEKTEEYLLRWFGQNRRWPKKPIYLGNYYREDETTWKNS